jgi:hypothetical protein
MPGNPITSPTRVASIFSPFAVRQIDAFIKKHPGADHVRFVHYTSADAALHIIRKKRMWMRNVTCMTDVSEVRHGQAILTKLFQDPALRKNFVDAMDACSAGAAQKAFEHFDQSWNDTSLETYITSISEHDPDEDQYGRLSMWRAFGGNVARVAFVFRVPLTAMYAGVFNLVFSPVAYLSDEQVRGVFLEVIENVGANCEFLKTFDQQGMVHNILNMLVAGVTCLKHPAFREEREWRLIYGPKRWPSPLIETTTEVVGGIPQIIHHIPFDSRVSGVVPVLDFTQLFDRLIIGPCNFPWSMADAYVRALQEVGVLEPKIVFSNIPIRM